MTRDEGERLYRRWLLELWNGDLSVAEELVAEDFVGSWPGEPEKVRGREALVAVVREGHSYFTELRFEIEVGPIVDADLVAARWRGRGTLRGGGAASFAGHDLLRVEAGEVGEYWVIAEQPV